MYRAVLDVMEEAREAALQDEAEAGHSDKVPYPVPPIVLGCGTWDAWVRNLLLETSLLFGQVRGSTANHLAHALGAD